MFSACAMSRHIKLGGQGAASCGDLIHSTFPSPFFFLFSFLFLTQHALPKPSIQQTHVKQHDQVKSERYEHHHTVTRGKNSSLLQTTPPRQRTSNQRRRTHSLRATISTRASPR